MGTWFSRGILNLEESPSQESDALREAYRSLGLRDELSGDLEAALHHTQQEHTKLEVQLRNEQKDETDAEQEHPGEKVLTILYVVGFTVHSWKTTFCTTNLTLLVKFYLHV